VIATRAMVVGCLLMVDGGQQQHTFYAKIKKNDASIQRIDKAPIR